MLTKIFISTFFITTIFYQIQCDDNFREFKPCISEKNECSEPGYKCLSCEISVFCIQLSNGEVITHEIPCKDDQTCSTLNGQCTKDLNENCKPESTVEFTCHQTGVFANPSDCKSYYICTKNRSKYVSTKVPCPKNWMFSPKTGRCTEKFDLDGCQKILPKCENQLQIQGVKGNPSMYVKCQCVSINSNSNKRVLYPVQFYCNNTDIFNGSICIDPTPKNGLDGKGKCKNEGKFYYPDNCMLYVECTEPEANPKYRTCGVGRKYNPYIEDCENLDCRNCDCFI